MKYLNICIITVFVVGLNACNRDELFEREQYKCVVGVLSEGIFNIFAEEHDLAAGDAESYTVGHIAASAGGTLPTTVPITVYLTEDPDLLRSYNDLNFASESYRYACYLPSNRYIIDQSPVIHIPQGERNGRMRILVRAEGLSPDSVYFIPFRVNRVSAYELNSNKSTVLYRVHLKNFWASTRSIPSYNHRGLIYTNSTGTPAISMMVKQMYPVSGDEVRIFPGNTTFQSFEAKDLGRWAIRLRMDAEGNVTISPWSADSDGLMVTQIDGDPDYPNVFTLIDDGFGTVYKTFLLCYTFVNPDTRVTYLVKEELRTEYRIDVE